MNQGSMFARNRTWVLAFGVFSTLFVVLAIIGGFRSYSPIPFWDMWGGYLGFFLRVSDGDVSVWWAQHNEHRIVLSRVLFWVDIEFFDGASWFLIAVNYFLVGANALLFWRILRSATATEKPSNDELVLSFFLIAWLFLWTQKENLTWGFQSQFILAQLLPLCALYWLHKSVVGNRAGRNFLVACGFGLASVGTMANGILVLPLMMIYALFTRQRIARVAVLFFLSVVTLYLYFYNYQAPAHHGSLLQAIKEEPVDLLQYVLIYVGSPFGYLVGKGTFGRIVAMLMGVFLVGSSVRFAIKSLRSPREATLVWALLFFILYIGGTALGTAGGRLIFGVNQALSARYTTPALMAWAALLILYTPTILMSLRMGEKKYIFILLSLALPMLVCQLIALKPEDRMLFDKQIAMLALELGVKDQKQVKYVYPDVQGVLSVAEKSSAKNLSVFGMYPYQNMREQLGTSIQQSALPECSGNLDAVEIIDGENRYTRIRGWIFNPTSNTIPEVIRLLNAAGTVVGYVLPGESRADIAELMGRKARYAGYRGYILADQTFVELTLLGEGTCQMQVSIPRSSRP